MHKSTLSKHILSPNWYNINDKCRALKKVKVFSNVVLFVLWESFEYSAILCYTFMDENLTLLLLRKYYEMTLQANLKVAMLFLSQI